MSIISSSLERRLQVLEARNRTADTRIDSLINRVTYLETSRLRSDRLHEFELEELRTEFSGLLDQAKRGFQDDLMALGRDNRDTATEIEESYRNQLLGLSLALDRQNQVIKHLEESLAEGTIALARAFSPARSQTANTAIRDHYPYVHAGLSGLREAVLASTHPSTESETSFYTGSSSSGSVATCDAQEEGSNDSETLISCPVATASSGTVRNDEVHDAFRMNRVDGAFSGTGTGGDSEEMAHGVRRRPFTRRDWYQSPVCEDEDSASGRA